MLQKENRELHDTYIDKAKIIVESVKHLINISKDLEEFKINFDEEIIKRFKYN